MNIGRVGTLALFSARCADNPTLYVGYKKQDGTEVQHRCTVPLFINSPGRKVDGVRGESKHTVVDVTGWGTTALGMALHLETGKEVSMEVRVDDYDARVILNDRPVLKSDGTELKVRKYSFTVIPDSIQYGVSSQKTIAEKRQDGRIPPGHDGQLPVEMLQVAKAQGAEAVFSLIDIASRGKEIYKSILEKWNAQEFKPGMTTFGNAKVVYNGVVQNAYQPGTPPAPTAPPAAPTAPSAPQEATVDGFTRAQMLAVGWTDESLLTYNNGYYSKLSLLGGNCKPAGSGATAAASVI